MDYIYVNFYVSNFLITWLNAGEMDYHIYVSFLHQSFLNYLAYCWRDGLSYIRQFFTSVIFELPGLMLERWIIISTSVFCQSFLNYLAYSWRDGLSYIRQFFTSVIFELLRLMLERWIIISTSVLYVSHF